MSKEAVSSGHSYGPHNWKHDASEVRISCTGHLKGRGTKLLARQEATWPIVVVVSYSYTRIRIQYAVRVRRQHVYIYIIDTYVPSPEIDFPTSVCPINP